MKELSSLSKKELLHELFAANDEYLLSLKYVPNTSQKKEARSYLRKVVSEVARRKSLAIH